MKHWLKLAGWLGVAAASAALAGADSDPEPTAAPTPAAVHHRLFWDATLGGDRSDNVYRDSSQQSDTGFDSQLQLGLRSRFSPRTFTQLRYEIDALSFPSANVENRTDQSVDGLFRHRLRESLSVEAAAGARFSRFPNIPAFDNQSLFGHVSLKSYLTPRTTVEAGINLEHRRYPDYDLDYGGWGFFTILGRELDRRTYAEISGTWERNDYTERTITTAPGSPLRRDHEWTFGGRLVRDLMPTLKLEASYGYDQQKSNGGFVSLGTTPAEDRLLGDYYSHSRHAVDARLRQLIRRGWYLTATGHWSRLTYDDRPALDADQQPLVPLALRQDRSLQGSLRWEMPVPGLPRKVDFGHFGLRFQYFHEDNASNDVLYHYHNTIFSIALTSWF